MRNLTSDNNCNIHMFPGAISVGVSAFGHFELFHPSYSSKLFHIIEILRVHGKEANQNFGIQLPKDGGNGLLCQSEPGLL